MLQQKDLILFTDFYQLTMAQGYWLAGKHQEVATFDYFYRSNPFEGGYAIFAGLSDVLEQLSELRFTDEHLKFLAEQGLNKDFLEYLKGFRFSGAVDGLREGEVLFPYAPILRITAPIIEAQVIETFLLNQLNFNTLIATKAARMRQVAGPKRSLIDMGLRRAQGYGGMQASKACIIGGFNGTSNVLSGYQEGTTLVGTQAHAWVQSFGDELASFRAFAEAFPNNCTLLVDTYDTLASGVPNAITVAKEMEARGQRVQAIRLDSGDLAYLSKAARKMLDEAGLGYIKIVASNSLDEYLIKSLLEQGAEIDAFGVGTRLVTAKGSPALGGVYKLVAVDGEPRIKVSENVIKITNPGRKRTLRYLREDGSFMMDGILLEAETKTDTLTHPFFHEKLTRVGSGTSEELFQPHMKAGKLVSSLPSLAESVAYAQTRLAQLPQEHKRFDNPHEYRVGLSSELLALRKKLLAQARGL